MGAPGVLAVLSAAGLTAAADGDRLLVMPADRITPALRETIRANKAVILAALRPASRWMLHFADAEPVTVTLDPPVTHAQVLALYPGAVAAVPAAEPRPQGMPPALAAMLAACVEAGMFDDGDGPIVGAMYTTDPAGAQAVVEAMHSRIGRCHRCAHLVRPGLSDGYCTRRTDRPHVYGFMHAIPADGGATCDSFEESR